MEHASLIAIEILKGARRWVAVRVALRRVLDSKSATPQQLKHAQEEHIKAANELEGLVMRLERFLHNTGTKFPTARGGDKHFPWRELFGAVGGLAKAVETALEGTKAHPGIVEAKVIDMDDKK